MKKELTFEESLSGLLRCGNLDSFCMEFFYVLLSSEKVFSQLFKNKQNSCFIVEQIAQKILHLKCKFWL